MANSLVNSLEREFRLIEEMDPSRADGFHVIYDREVPFELRAADGSDSGALEGIKVKIVCQGEDGAPNAVRVELSSEADLFFHHTCVINTLGYNQLREDQKLMCEFKDFGATLTKMFNQAIKEPQHNLVVLLLHGNGDATLQMIQNLEFKFCELLALPFCESPENVVRQHVTYRYNAMRSRLSIMTAKLQDVQALVRVRDPQVQRSLADGRTVEGLLH